MGFLLPPSCLFHLDTSDPQSPLSGQMTAMQLCARCHDDGRAHVFSKAADISSAAAAKL